MVWLIYPDKRLIEVLTVDDFQFLYDNDILTGGAVLPEFSVAVADIFRMGHEA
jgi:Uma2 family endonuclease